MQLYIGRRASAGQAMLLCLAVVGQGGGQAGRWALSAAAGSQGGSRDWSVHCTTCIRSDNAGLICCAQLTRKGSGQRRIHRLCAVAALQAQPAASGTAGVVGCPGGQVDASGRTTAYASTSQSKLAGVEVVWLPVPPWQHLKVAAHCCQTQGPPLSCAAPGMSRCRLHNMVLWLRGLNCKGRGRNC